MQNVNVEQQIYSMIKECIQLVDNEIDLHMEGKEADADICTLIKIKKHVVVKLFCNTTT